MVEARRLVGPACKPGINININNFDGQKVAEIDEEEDFPGVIGPRHPWSERVAVCIAHGRSHLKAIRTKTDPSHGACRKHARD